MSVRSHFQIMAEYNRWMNEKLLEAAGKMDPAALFDDRGAFFGSIGGTMNHLLVGDTIWLKRFMLHPAAFTALQPVADFPAPSALSDVLYESLSALDRARRETDAVIVDFVAETREADFEAVLSYHNMAGEPQQKSFSLLLQHFFNHQTHHRGQITTLLHQTGIDIGTTDLLVLIPEKD